MTPFGALAGGILATSALGVQGTLVFASLGTLLATGPFLLPAIRCVRTMPTLRTAVGRPDPVVSD